MQADAGGRCSQVIFVYTNSYDLSTDALVKRLGNNVVFRFNLDLWREYVIRIYPRKFEISNPSGRSVSCSQVAKFLWRKPLTNQQLFPDRIFPKETNYEEEELAYAMQEVWNRFYLSGRAVLIDPVSDVISGKLTQARIAAKYFHVPDWVFVSGGLLEDDSERVRVVKSLTSLRTDDRSVLFTKNVAISQLAPTSPWLIQDLVVADFDVTVVVVRDSLFAFELSRAEFPKGVVDWRHARKLSPSQAWRPHHLPTDVANSIMQLMEELSLHYGRLDFLLSNKTYSFLEVNPNGEWGWLDHDGTAGILDKLSKELSLDSPCHPLPNPRIIKFANLLSK